MSSFEFIYNGEKINIYDSVVPESFSFEKRADEVFATGGFIFYSKTIKEPIPPYTFLKRVDSNNIEYQYLFSSKVNYNLAKKVYIHTAELLELTAILNGFILGSKNLGITGTNKFDYDKANIIVKLINQEYGINFVLDNPSVLNKNDIEYSFGAGTTAFIALSQIATEYNKRVTISKFDGSAYHIEFIDLDLGKEYALENERIVGVRKSQNINNYCKYLESELTNVIDRNSPTYIKDVVASSGGDVRLTIDNAIIELPTRIEEIKHSYIKTNNFIGYALSGITKEMLWSRDDGLLDGKILKLGEWFATFASDDTPYLARAYDKFIKEFPNQKIYLDYARSLNYKCQSVAGGTYSITQYEPIKEPGIVNYRELNALILPFERHRLLPLAEQPLHAFYRNGDNKIEGFNATYDAGFWQAITGQQVAPTFSDLIRTALNYDRDHEVTTEDGVKLLDKPIIRFSQDIRENLFAFEYIPIINPKLRIEKQDQPENETGYTPIARSYGLSSSFIDYDRLINSMKQKNEMLGRIDITLDYYINGKESPKAGQKIVFEGKPYYIATIIEEDLKRQNIIALNLVKSYNKVADAIKIKSQYNATKLPLNAVVERPILIKSDNVIKLNRSDLENFYFKIRIDSMKALFVKPILEEQADGTLLFFYEAKTNASIANQIITKSGEYQVKPITYGNIYNECFRINLELVQISNSLDINEAYNLPYYTGDVTSYFGATKIVYKDAREKLTFSLMLTKGEILDA